MEKAKNALEKADGMPEIFAKHIKEKDGRYIVFCKDIKQQKGRYFHLPFLLKIVIPVNFNLTIFIFATNYF